MLPRLIVLAALVVSPVLLPAASQLPPFGGAAEHVADLQRRRAAALDAFDSGDVVVLWSASPRLYSNDTDYEYRQESNLLYLTGFDEPESTLVLIPGAEGPREFLFVRARDPFAELWNGRIPSIEEVSTRTGIDAVFAQERDEAFEAFFDGWLGTVDGEPGSAAEAGRLAAPPPDTPVRLRVLSPRAAEPESPARQQWAEALAAERPQTTVADARPVLTMLRRVKSPYEQDVMRRAVEIAAEAHIEGMKAARPGGWEYEVEAAIEYWFLKNGAMSWGYPSIVGSGPNATILHYQRSTRQMQDGDLLLVDAGATFQHMTGDITRTYPVNGRFTEPQREIYELVLAALEAGTAAARPGRTVADINRAVRATLGRGLLELGLVVDPDAVSGTSSQIDLWFPHGPVHGIGIDVHESVGSLVPGVTFVVEPGLYIRPDRLELLAREPDGAAIAERIRPAVERYGGIGIRIEDSLLMTDSGVEVMSGKAPKAIEAIEAVVGTGEQ